MGCFSEDKSAGEDSYRLIAGLVTDVLFEYEIKADRIMNRVCRDGVFGKCHWLDKPRVNLRPYIYQGDLPLFDHFMEEMENGKERVYVELRMKYQDGNFCWTVFEGKHFTTEDGTEKIVGRIKAMEEHKGEKYGLWHNAKKRDPLTKLLNYESCLQVLGTYYRGRPAEQSVIVVLDIDNFTRINCTKGHFFGDEVLIGIADAIKEAAGDEQLVGRVGGDTYIVCIRDVKDRDKAREVAVRMQRAVAGLCIGEGKEKGQLLSASVGCTFYPEDGQEFYQLFERAKLAAAWCKECSKGQVVFWNREMEEVKRPDLSEDRKFDKQYIQECDSFGYKLVELAFRLMEENTDVSSTINLLMYKLAVHYDISGICIREITCTPYEMKSSYEYLGETYKKSTLGQLQTSLIEEWEFFRGAYNDGYFCFNSQTMPEKMPTRRVIEPPVQSMLEVPMYRKGKFIGCVDFCDAYKDREWNKSEIHTLKIFGRIIADFLLNIRDLEDTTEKMEQLKERDSLTGLYRYDVFLRRLQTVIESPKDYVVCIVYSDIRHFKYINEHYGIVMGDQLLREFAKELISNRQGLLFASRVFSDNLVAAVRIPPEMSADKIGAIIKECNEEFAAKMRKQFFNGKLSINSGYYIVKDNDLAELAVSNANMARKRAKESSRNTRMPVMFTDSMLEELYKQMQMTDDLPNAIQNRELCVYFQPKVECRTGRLIGAEALVRWRKADGTFLYPDSFIPVFERNGSIVDLDYYVYHEVFRWLEERIVSGEPVVPVSVNVSRFHLHNNAVLEYIKGLFVQYKVPPYLLEFELTESLYMESMEHVIPIALELRRMGAKVSMDDFGSGFSSLNALNSLPIDILKLDKVFMKGTLGEGDKAVITCVVGMAKKLHIRVLCEGVENAEQEQFLADIGCDMIQGYFYGKPMPAGEFEKLLGDL